jgi:polyphosphate kinase
MRTVLARFDYDGKDVDVVAQPDPQIVQRGRDAVGD